MEKVIAYWDCWDDKTKEFLGRVPVTGCRLEPLPSEEIDGVGKCKRGKVIRYEKSATLRAPLPVYDVYVSLWL